MIYFIEDDNNIRELVIYTLNNSGMEAVGFGLPSEFWKAVEKQTPSLIMLDIMLPHVDGFTLCREIRRKSIVPVLFLTAKSLDTDKEEAYSKGGDDYLVKPFSSNELLLKVEALTRRYNRYGAKTDAQAQIVKIGFGITLNPDTREVFKYGERVDVRDKEMELLLYLSQNRGRAISSDELYESVWGEMPLPSSNNTVTVHMLNLRRKLEDVPSSPKLIRTVWGKGYQID